MLYAFKNFITDYTSSRWMLEWEPPSSTAATMVLWELKVLLVHASCNVITLSRRPYTHSLRAINDLIVARKVGNLLCGCPHIMISHHHFWLHSPMRAFASCIVLFHTLLYPSLAVPIPLFHIFLCPPVQNPTVCSLVFPFAFPFWLITEGQVFHCKLSILRSTLFTAILFVCTYSLFITMLSIIWYLLLPRTIFPFTIPSRASFSRQFLLSQWPSQFLFLLFISSSIVLLSPTLSNIWAIKKLFQFYMLLRCWWMILIVGL